MLAFVSFQRQPAVSSPAPHLALHSSLSLILNFVIYQKSFDIFKYHSILTPMKNKLHSMQTQKMVFKLPAMVPVAQSPASSPSSRI